MNLYHSTTAENAKKILRSQQLGVAGKRTFFFYGKPSFTLLSRHEPIRSNPIAFIVRRRAVSNYEVCFGFDSGGYQKGYYDEYLEHASCAEEASPHQLADFKLEPNIAGTKRHCVSVFGGEQAYFHNRPLALEQISDPSWSKARLHAVYSATSVSGEYDPPAHTVEIQTEKIFDTSSQDVDKIIVPRWIYEKDAELSDLIGINKIDTIQYGNESPASDQDHFEDLAEVMSEAQRVEFSRVAS